MITISHGGGALGTPDSDYEFYLPEYVGHGFAKMVIKTISIATNLDPGPFQSVNYSTHLCIHDGSFFFTALPLCCAELALQEGAYILNGYIGKLLLDLFVQQVPTTVTTADMKIIDLVEQVLTGQVLEVGVDLHKPADDLPIHLNFSHLEPSLVIIV